MLHKRKTRGIYFLYDGDEIVYVGKSDKNCESRVNAHYHDRGKLFDNYEIIKFGKYADLDQIEQEYIKEHNPKYNIVYANQKPLKSKKILKLLLAGLIRTKEIPDDNPTIDLYRKEIQQFFGD